jgi:3-phenylpropionate/trans-cinnamate dioxygenase ferredoxin subunit
LESGEFVRVGALAEMPAGSMRPCQVAGREVLVCHTKVGLYAVDNICTHAFARMSDGRLRGTRLICPLHGASFDVRTGDVLGAPATRPLAAHAVRLVDGEVEVSVNLKAAQLRNPL